MKTIKPQTFEIEEETKEEKDVVKPLTFDDLEGEIEDELPRYETQNQNSLKKIFNFFGTIGGIFAAFMLFIIMILLGDFISSIKEIFFHPSVKNIFYIVGFTIFSIAVAVNIKNIISQIKSLDSAKELKEKFKKQKENPNSEIIKISLSLIKKYKDNKDLSAIIERLKDKLSNSPIYEELYQLNRELFLNLDKKADKIIKNASIQSGIATAISNIPIIDMFLTFYRSLYLVKEISLLYGYKPGIITTYSIMKQTLFNIAFAGSSEALIDYMPDIGASHTANLFSKSIGQGAANAILMARIGRNIKKACRPMDYEDKEEEKSLLKSILSGLRVFSEKNSK